MSSPGTTGIFHLADKKHSKSQKLEAKTREKNPIRNTAEIFNREDDKPMKQTTKGSMESLPHLLSSYSVPFWKRCTSQTQVISIKRNAMVSNMEQTR